MATSNKKLCVHPCVLFDKKFSPNTFVTVVKFLDISTLSRHVAVWKGVILVSSTGRILIYSKQLGILLSMMYG